MNIQVTIFLDFMYDYHYAKKLTFQKKSFVTTEKFLELSFCISTTFHLEIRQKTKK